MPRVPAKFSRKLLANLEASFAAANLVPATRWDKFKLRYFPLWLLHRFPVKMKERPAVYSRLIKHRDEGEWDS